VTRRGTPPVTAAAAPSRGPVDSRVTIDDFMKVELRVARCCRGCGSKSKKLLRLTVDRRRAADDRRRHCATLHAGAAGGRSDCHRRQPPAGQVDGIESNGMVLAASTEGGKPILVSVDESLPPARECG
jgi:methionyl-tRNA synthetase